jgi:hypothetical protein
MTQTPRSELTTEEQLAELRGMLEASTGHHRTVIRPNVQTGWTELKNGEWAGERCAVHGPGPVTIVTFYISDCQR